jgi:post-segregation antitoxin (ccd killing protein)
MGDMKPPKDTLKSISKKFRTVAARPKIRTKTGIVRWTPEEYAELIQRAKELQITVSQYVRHTALGKKIVPKIDEAWLNELRRIGALIKHHYPAVKSWNDQEKERYWQTRDQLLELANKFAKQIGFKKIK